MEHVQWNGSGVVVSTSGQRKSVQFQLDQYQEEVPDGFGGMIPGMKTLLGTIDPPCFVSWVHHGHVSAWSPECILMLTIGGPA